MGVFLKTERSASAKPGPKKLLRRKFHQVPAAGSANDAGLNHCTKREPPTFWILWLTPAKGVATLAGRWLYSLVPEVSVPVKRLIGCPPFSVMTEFNTQPCVSSDGPRNPGTV